ncbi:HlyD family type I secretion periplasmic adaptor subunit [Pararhizobium mangrovi]|uniref:Membrane fusion protein (MFP) family protein n=1 Tax=Pararhizobium mangrovi TaxID=2590452 RepID=A0A506U5S9_9HYPH|nr:HlyD family type I secretion periplasmic adaptor subunit [Pararhizobium mangrovi]TPW27939.1 HlyD family type I secretion periplasmic adaptor subunit [Pararhizobium mangrovi]
MAEITPKPSGTLAPFSSWGDTVVTDMRRPGLIALATTALFVLGFGLWAGFAPIAGAVVSQGVVVASGKNQVVQHLEGGIVRSILVHEGDRVEKGDPLLRLDPTEAETQTNRLTKQVVALSARIARLKTVRAGDETLTFSDKLKTMAGESGSEDVLAEQRNEFAARQKLHSQETFILNQRLKALGQKVDGLSAQKKSASDQLATVKDAMARQKTLLEKGLTSRSQYTTLLLSQSQMLGQVGETKSAILSARTNIEKTREELSQLDTKRTEQAVSQIDTLQSQLSDTREKLQAAEDVFRRVVIRAPCDGVVVRMHVNAIGSVVKPADPLVEILPTGRKLIVEAKIRPQDIDKVTVGQEARLRFAGLNNRTTPTVPASVSYVSADRLVDDKTGKRYYVARLQLDGKGKGVLPDGMTLRPGMPVEAYVETGSRTFLDYLTKPIRDSFHRAFRES